MLPDMSDTQQIPKDQWAKAEVNVLEEEILITKTPTPLQDTVQTGQGSMDYNLRQSYLARIAQLEKDLANQKQHAQNLRVRNERAAKEKQRLINKYNKTLCAKINNVTKSIDSNYHRLTRTTHPIRGLGSTEENLSKGGAGLMFVIAALAAVTIGREL